MGISLSFQNKKTQSEFTSMSYGTCSYILDLCGLDPIRDYCVEIPATKAVRAFELFLANMKHTSLNDCKEVRFVRQLVRDYNDFVKAGHKPRWLCGG